MHSSQITLVAAATSLLLSSCNEPAFEDVERGCGTTAEALLALAPPPPVDVLVVVDNSGSMCAEQAKLVETFFDPDCPIDVEDVASEHLDPTGSALEELVEQCGFVQLLAAHQVDWRLGFITTDVGPCDSRYAVVEEPEEVGESCSAEPAPERGRVPQRGCLQPYDLDNREATRVLKAGDGDVGEKATAILDNLRTHGSSFERGLDAMKVFLDPESERAPGCEQDLDVFLREEAKLVVLFLTDEDDCSHADGEYGFVDENTGQTCTHDVEEPNPGVSPAACDEQRDQLAPTSLYAQFLSAYKGDPNEVSVGVIAGGVGVCDAEPGTRYGQMAEELGVGRGVIGSICAERPHAALFDYGTFPVTRDVVRLADRPPDTRKIVVEILRPGEEEPTPIPRIPDGEDPAGQSGWQYDGDVTITLHGDARPRAGDEVRVYSQPTTGGACEPDGD